MGYLRPIFLSLYLSLSLSLFFRFLYLPFYLFLLTCLSCYLFLSPFFHSPKLSNEQQRSSSIVEKIYNKNSLKINKNSIENPRNDFEKLGSFRERVQRAQLVRQKSRAAVICPRLQFRAREWVFTLFPIIGTSFFLVLFFSLWIFFLERFFIIC